MRPQFITNNLARVSKPIRVFRDMINLLDTDYEEEIRQDKLSSLYSLLFDLFNNMYHNYDFDELYFIAKRMYNRTGVVESLELLETYFDLEIDANISSEYELTINLSTEVEVFKDLDLGIIQIRDLAKDLLYFGSMNTIIDKVTYQADLLNIIIRVNNISVTPIVDRYYEKNYQGSAMEIGSMIVKEIV